MPKITFKQAIPSNKTMIFSWLAEPHVQEFWDNSQAHKDDIVNFINGRKEASHYCNGKYIYWIALSDKKPFAMIMTIQASPEDDIEELKLSHLSKTGNTYGIDFMIGNPNYLGKGYAATTLAEFIDFFQQEFDPKADTFLIDPTADNPRAKHVYEKAGFEHVDDFMMEGSCSGSGKMHHLLLKKHYPNESPKEPTLGLARALINEQFPEYCHLKITDIEKQGHDNRTYKLGHDMLIRMPTAESYALKLPKEQEILPKLAKHLSTNIPKPIKKGLPSADYPYPFSIYRWLEGKSANLLETSEKTLEPIAAQLASFLKELQAIRTVDGPPPGQHNWWRGDHLSVYDKGAREQIASLKNSIDSNAALTLWEEACATKWKGKPLWIHGDFASGNILIEDNQLVGVIDFGGMAVGDPACDLVISWTYLSGKSRDTFIASMKTDSDTWLRAKGWALWKASFELCQIENKESKESKTQKDIINSLF